MRIGRYECIGELAAGGMGTVYLARVCGEGGFERLVALKVMHAHLEKDDQFRSMFLDEARLAAMIRHPNVVSTVDVQRSPEGLFLVMDYVEGPSLNALRKRFTRAGVPIPLGSFCVCFATFSGAFRRRMNCAMCKAGCWRSSTAMSRHKISSLGRMG